MRRLAFALTAAVLILASVAYALWRREREPGCAPLLHNIELVAANGVRRESDLYDVELADTHGGALSDVTPGDFAGAWTAEEVRNCLGEGWSESHHTARAGALGQAWVFFRRGFPTVTYVQSYRNTAGEGREVRARVVIDPSTEPSN